MQEFVGNKNRLVEVSARIAPQIEEQLIHPLGLEAQQRLRQFRMRRAGKLAEFDVSDAVGQHEGGLDALDRHGAAHHLDLDRIGNAVAVQGQLHAAVTRAAQTADDLLLGNLLSGHEGVVDAHDAVTGSHAGLVARPRGDDVDHRHGIGQHVEDHANAVELPLEGFVDRLHLGGGDVDRMRIKLLDEQRKDGFGQRIKRNGVDILLLDECERVVEFVFGQRHARHRLLQLRLDAVAPQEAAEKQAEGHARSQNQWKENGTFRIQVIHDSLKK